MELRQLRAFVAVAEELHFSRAAERLHVAQPPLSQLIRSLERELGTKLFERTTRSVRLTSAGEALLGPARAIQTQVEGAKRVTRAAHSGEIGRVKVGFAGTSGYAVLPTLVREVTQRHPGIELELNAQTYSGEAVTAVRDGKLDLGIVGLPVPAGIVAHVVRNESLMVALPSDHGLAARKTLTAGDVADERFVAYPVAQGSLVREAMFRVCADAGFVPNIVQDAPDPYSLLAMVGAGVGIAMVVGSSVHVRLDGVTYVPLAGTTLTLPIALAWRESNESAALRAVVDVASSVLPHAFES